jgi:uncharacterized protein YecE (DUF72 family)
MSSPRTPTSSAPATHGQPDSAPDSASDAAPDAAHNAAPEAALDLFGFAQPASDKKPARDKSKARSTSNETRGTRAVAVAAATPREDLRTLQNRLPSGVHLGTSSWSFPGWAGLVYDAPYTESKLARDGLTAYATHPLLKTVSIDRTFYAPLAERDFADYAKQIPAELAFRFVVKAPMAVTSSYLRDETGNFSDSPFYLDAAYAIDSFIAPASVGLAATLGPLVFQFPPQGKRIVAQPDGFINRLYRFLNALPPGILYAVELRDPELLTPRFFKCLETTRVSFCVASHARMPSPAEQIRLMNTHLSAAAIAAQPFICRWSLHAGFKYEDAKSRYFPFDRLVDEDIDSRSALAAAALAAAHAQQPSFITINNKAEGSAPLSVEKLAALIAASESSV